VFNGGAEIRTAARRVRRKCRGFSFECKI
jgi:DNA-binding transcriptional regulator YiaG